MNTPTRAAAKKKVTMKMDMAMDKKKGIKEGSPYDVKMDKKMGFMDMTKKSKKK